MGVGEKKGVRNYIRSTENGRRIEVAAEAGAIKS